MINSDEPVASINLTSFALPQLLMMRGRRYKRVGEDGDEDDYEDGEDGDGDGYEDGEDGGIKYQGCGEFLAKHNPSVWWNDDSKVYKDGGSQHNPPITPAQAAMLTQRCTVSDILVLAGRCNLHLYCKAFSPCSEIYSAIIPK